MSKTFFNISEQKTKVINFIKKHKNILGLVDGSKAITTEYLDKLKNANTNEFFRLLDNVRLKFGQNFVVFSDNRDEKHHMIQLWLPIVLSKVESDTAIEIACSSKSLEAVIETNCTWLNMTPTCWKMFEALFDFYEEVKLSDSAIIG